MHSETNPRGRLARRNFRLALDGMREKGVVEERILTGYVCDECDVEDPVGYRVVADYRVSSAAAYSLQALIISGALVVLGLVLIPIVIGIPILIAGVGYFWYSAIQERRGKESETLLNEKGELACAVCYGSPVSVDTTRGMAILKRIHSKQPPSTNQGSSHG